MWEWQRHGFSSEAQIKAWAWLPALPEQIPAPQGPLAGLRFGVKDVIDIQGMPTRYGCEGLQAEPRQWDATVVAQLRAAGALPLGKTVTAEFAFVQPGPTCNPHALAHTPGGSSSGSAAAVAAGMVDFALGTQTGGSMMRPAAYCGVVGFKPSFGLVHRQGMMVTAETLDTIGWFTRDVALSSRVLSALTLRSASPEVLPRKAVLIRDWPTLEPQAASVLEAAAARLQAQGVQIEVIDTVADCLQHLGRLHQSTVRYELARGMLPVLQASAHLLSPSIKAAIAEGLAMDWRSYGQVQQERRDAATKLAAMLGDASCIIAPSATGPAPQGLASTGSSVPNRPWSLLGWPSLHLPVTHSAQGLPLGIQLVGHHGKDHDLHAYAGAVAKALAQTPPVASTTASQAAVSAL